MGLGLFASSASGQPRAIALSAVEHALGASPIHRVAGHGRLSVGITRDADLAVLTWPSPSCCDQLTHLASNALDARDQPRTGVREGFGGALGFAIVTGAAAEVAWLHNPAQFRVVSAGYVDATSLVPFGEYEHIATGLRVRVTDAVLPRPDVLQRRVRVTLPTGSAVTAVRLLSHMNFGPTRDVVPRVPLGDVLADNRNDFAAIYDPSLGGFVHFRPATANPIRDVTALVSPAPMGDGYYGPLDALMRRSDDIAPDTDALAAALDARFGEGVYAAFSTRPAATGFHAGVEDDTFCDALGGLIDNVVALGRTGIALTIPPAIASVFRCTASVRVDTVFAARSWQRRPPSAWRDAQDGTLSGSRLAAWRADTALETPMTREANTFEARVFVGMGATAAAARNAVSVASAQTADEVEAGDRDAWAESLRGVRMPRVGGALSGDDAARVNAAAERAILHVLEGTDRETGMIVASISRQAPYGLDWPRDGAFFDYLFDAVGLAPRITQRLDWALALQRENPLRMSDLFSLTDPPPPLDPRTGTRQYPEAAWEMNYYNNGEMGGFYRFEIDNTAWMIWSAAAHVAFVPEGERATLAARYWPRVARSAELLAAWRDANTGLQAPANEDDNAAFTATLHGATSVFAALEASARLARLTDHATEAARWERRASELRDAAIRAFYDPARGRFINDVTGAAAANPGSSTLGATSWLVWPARLLPFSDPRMARQVRYDLEQVLAILRGDPGTEGGAYLTKTTLAAAVFLAGGGDPSLRPLLNEAMVRLARDVIDPETQSMGEVFITIRDAQGRVLRRENRVSIPHLWEGALFALTVVAMQEGSGFNLDLTGLPPAQTPPPGTVPLPEPVVDAGVIVDAGAMAGADAGAPPSGISGGGCGCHTGPAASTPGALLAMALWGLWLTRRRVSRPV